MSRLDRYRQKQFMRKVTLFVCALIVLVIFISTIGFNLLIKTGLLAGQIGNGNKTNQTPIAFFGTLDVDTPPIATNSAKILVSGSVSGYDTIEIAINNSKKKALHNQSSFSEVVGDLSKGQNEIKVIAKSSKNAKEVDQKVFTILYRDEKPKLELSEPADGTKTSNTEIKVVGKTDPDVTIRINDSPVVIDAQGTFQTFVRLKDGDNKITIVATDLAGNTQTKELTVNYSKDN